LSGYTKLGSFYCENFFVASRRHWKASFTKIHLIEMYNFRFEHENWVHFVVKSFSLPPSATEKLVWVQFSKASFSVAAGEDEIFFTTK
jgi:hypothetical protein